MSKIDHLWRKEAPPKPDVYTTRRNESKYLTLRYWDGERWFEIGYSGNRGGTPFKWPKGSRTRRPSWATKYKNTMGLRKIGTLQGAIQWGEPYKVYDEKEVLAFLVKTGRLDGNWKTAYQEHMRAAEAPCG